MRSIVFRFADIGAFSVALGDARGSLALPKGETVSDGEWVLAIFEIGSRRRATAAAARGVRAAGDPHVAFERRDWERLLAFVAARSEAMRAGRSSGAPPSMRSPSIAPREYDGEDPDAPPASMIDSSRVPFTARVLLVDDDDATRESVSSMLSEIGLIVEAVGSGEEAHVRMREASFDALVLDFNIHGIDPLDFVRGLRNDPSRTPIPVLILSHRPSSRDVVNAFASGADDFLPKPFRAPELGARVFGLLRRARLARLASILPGPNSPRGGAGGGVS